MNRSNLTGVWQGLYSYPIFQEPVFFVATLISFETLISGTTREAVIGQHGAPLSLTAALEGAIAGHDISFAKTYDGSGGFNHTVSYEGTLSADYNEIEGIWRLPDWSGRFLMIRGQGKKEAVIRREFAKA